jgi:hypothetical protein
MKTFEEKGFSLRGGNYFRLNFKPLCISQYNMFMKRVDRESCFVAYKLCPFQFISGVQKSISWIQIEIQRISGTSGKACATDEIQAAQTQSDTDSVQP